MDQTEEILGQAAGPSSSSKPVCLIVLGMASSGKTAFVNRLSNYLNNTDNQSYVINLDPACSHVPYVANIDIRDTVKYKEVMKHYGLGPNGAILTCLNLFCTKFDQVLDLIDKNKSQKKYFIFDTPGQIEVFTWSASGKIITEALASSYTTVIVYVMDTSKSVRPTTFMNNMVNACSILYKSLLPFIVVMNKIDIIDNSFAVEWMTDFFAFDEALERDPRYISTLMRSMALDLEEFYKDLLTVGVSSLTGKNMDKFLELIDTAETEFETIHKPELERQKNDYEADKKRKDEERLSSLKNTPGIGDKVDLVTSSRDLSEVNEIYFKHTGDDSSSDSEGEEIVDGSEDTQERTFQQLVDKRKLDNLSKLEKINE